ncbi:MAG: quinone oxidoreductase [Acidobacteriia bacterium]|nr:quinone oxidoreductase [Terriglobia bacterium]
MKAIQIKKTGGSEVLEYGEVSNPLPGAGEALVKIEAIGVNFIDVYHRTGLYPLPLPFTPGSEAAGRVAAVGPGVTEVKEGDRVAYAMARGAYAEYACVPVRQLVTVPNEIDSRTAAATMLQGMTAHYLLKSTYPVKSGETLLIHAAAGGVGLLVCQIGKKLGARVIGTTSTAEKAALARQAGADEVILYSTQDFESEVKRLTDGKGVQVVYDSVGRDTYLKSLNCLAPRGMLVMFGQSSGAVGSFDPLLLSQHGSLFLTRPSLAHYTANAEELRWRAGELFEWIKSGALKIRIDRTYPLRDAAQAHRDLEARKTAGKVLLIP